MEFVPPCLAHPTTMDRGGLFKGKPQTGPWFRDPKICLTARRAEGLLLARLLEASAELGGGARWGFGREQGEEPVPGPTVDKQVSLGPPGRLSSRAIGWEWSSAPWVPGGQVVGGSVCRLHLHKAPGRTPGVPGPFFFPPV